MTSLKLPKSYVGAACRMRALVVASMPKTNASLGPMAASHEKTTPLSSCTDVDIFQGAIDLRGKSRTSVLSSWWSISSMRRIRCDAALRTLARPRFFTNSAAAYSAVKVSRLDHLVLTVKDIEATCRFYTQVLGMEVVKFGRGARIALAFGEQKINLHQLGKEIEPKAHLPTAGSADLCFVTEIPLSTVQKHAESVGVSIIEGPVERTGALGSIRSIYFRDPDLNLIEIPGSDYQSRLGIIDRASLDLLYYEKQRDVVTNEKTILLTINELNTTQGCMQLQS